MSEIYAADRSAGKLGREALDAWSGDAVDAYLQGCDRTGFRDKLGNAPELDESLVSGHYQTVFANAV